MTSHGCVVQDHTRRSLCINATQVISNNRDANNSEFVRKIKEVWPARCQADNERYIRSLKAKLEAALQKCVRS